ncbi:uncharacterized protein LOC106081500 [Stomoxys calcitrans]|uniref:uncharacterized protein LOC106081500 n=1 Tax=Stomoxys calcitrans TaxID=35570 RepID=UPI0027E32F94|nr:uncharacterized protein LOC106081500 [Stomoxys calcitrans]
MGDRDYSLCPRPQRKQRKNRSLAVLKPPVSAVERNRNFLQNYVSSLQLPPWYRGISTYQMRAAENLAYAILNDLDQKCERHTLHCLTAMGLEPLPTKSQLLTLLALCGGSDIAFLWFLKEWLYESPKEDNASKEYSLNEQLIMSCIAHLDMGVTIRELDKILPLRKEKLTKSTTKLSKKKPTKSNEIGLKQKQAIAAARSGAWLERDGRRSCRSEIEIASHSTQYRKHFTPSTAKTGPPCFSSDPSSDALGIPEQKCSKRFAPYFEKVKPMVQTRSWYTVPEPGRTANLGQYQYKATEDNFEGQRWFKDYHIKSSKEKSDVSQILNNFKAAMINETMVQKLIEQHKDVENLNKSFERELERSFHKISEKLGNQTEMTTCQVLVQRLQYDIDKYQREFRKMAENHRKHCTLDILSCGLDREKSLEGNLKPICSETHTPKTSLISCGKISDESKQLHRATLSSGCVLGKLVGHGKNVKPEMETLWQCEETEDTGYNTNENHPHTEDCGCLLGQGNSCSRHCICCKGRAESSSSLLKFREKYSSQSFFDNNPSSCSLSQEKYFEATTADHCHRFDYSKIFQHKENNSQIMELKMALIEAVDSDIALLSEMQRQEYANENSQEKLNKAINQCYQKLVNHELNKSENHNLPHSDGRLNYNMDYYDPNDDELMDRMLKDALGIMSEDTQFVLPSMPEAHCLPLLREWIRLRYGKVYRQAELNKLCDTDQMIFKTLTNVGLSVQMPRNRDIGLNLDVDYSCRDYLLKKSQSIRKKFYKNINKALMAQARVLYFAMRPFLCANGPPTNTIFAYVPARNKDICNFRPWKSTEFNEDNRLMAVERLREIQAKRQSLYL